MALKLIHTAESESKMADGRAMFVAKVYRDVEWNEYRVKFSACGVRNEKADYHTDDKADAIDNAAYMIRHNLSTAAHIEFVEARQAS